MIIESVDLLASPENHKELQTALSFPVGPTRVEFGCVSCHLYQNVCDPNGFRFECLWNTEADFVRHLRSDIYKQFLILMELSVEPPCVLFHTIFDTKGLELVHAARQQQTEQVSDN
jgi:quinol monooxygenase YgiN